MAPSGSNLHTPHYPSVWLNDQQTILVLVLSQEDSDSINSSAHWKSAAETYSNENSELITLSQVGVRSCRSISSLFWALVSFYFMTELQRSLVVHLDQYISGIWEGGTLFKTGTNGHLDSKMDILVVKDQSLCDLTVIFVCAVLFKKGQHGLVPSGPIELSVISTVTKNGTVGYSKGNLCPCRRDHLWIL